MTYKKHKTLGLLKQLIIMLLSILICTATKSQPASLRNIDSLVKLVDSDSTLIPQEINLDTVYMTDGHYKREMIAKFFIYKKSDSKTIKKIVWNSVDGQYYNNISLYIDKMKAIKGSIQCYYKADDIVPQDCKTNTVFYLKNNKIINARSLTQSNCNDNITWYLLTLNEMCKLSGIKINLSPVSQKSGTIRTNSKIKKASR